MKERMRGNGSTHYDGDPFFFPTHRKREIPKLSQFWSFFYSSQKIIDPRSIVVHYFIAVLSLFGKRVEKELRAR